MTLRKEREREETNYYINSLNITKSFLCIKASAMKWNEQRLKRDKAKINVYVLSILKSKMNYIYYLDFNHYRN